MQWRSAGKLRVLSFDTENRPLAYLGGDFTTGEITAIAASWEGQQEVRVWLLGETPIRDMLDPFVGLSTEHLAAMVVRRPPHRLPGRR